MTEQAEIIDKVSPAIPIEEIKNVEQPKEIADSQILTASESITPPVTTKSIKNRQSRREEKKQANKTAKKIQRIVDIKTLRGSLYWWLHILGILIIDLILPHRFVLLLLFIISILQYFFECSINLQSKASPGLFLINLFQLPSLEKLSSNLFEQWSFLCYLITIITVICRIYVPGIGFILLLYINQPLWKNSFSIALNNSLTNSLPNSSNHFKSSDTTKTRTTVTTETNNLHLTDLIYTIKTHNMHIRFLLISLLLFPLSWFGIFTPLPYLLLALISRNWFMFFLKQNEYVTNECEIRELFTKLIFPSVLFIIFPIGILISFPPHSLFATLLSLWSWSSVRFSLHELKQPKLSSYEESIIEHLSDDYFKKFSFIDSYEAKQSISRLLCVLVVFISFYSWLISGSYFTCIVFFVIFLYSITEILLSGCAETYLWPFANTTANNLQNCVNLLHPNQIPNTVKHLIPALNHTLANVKQNLAKNKS